MLKAIRAYLETHGPSETAAVARHLSTDESAVLGMLEFLEQRGQVRRIVIDCGTGCTGCTGCGKKKAGHRIHPQDNVIFWTEPKLPGA